MPFHKGTPKAEPTVPFPTAILSRYYIYERPEKARRLAQIGSRISFGKDAPRCKGGYTQCAVKSGNRLAYPVLGGKQSLSSFTKKAIWRTQQTSGRLHYRTTTVRFSSLFSHPWQHPTCAQTSTLAVSSRRGFFPKCLAVWSMPHCRGKHFVTQKKTIALSVSPGWISGTPLATSGTCLSNTAWSSFTFRPISANWFLAIMRWWQQRYLSARTCLLPSTSPSEFSKDACFHQFYSTSVFSLYLTCCTSLRVVRGGHTLSLKTLKSAYADDLELCSWSPPACQSLLNLTQDYLSWSRSLIARPDKCFATAMRLTHTTAHSKSHYGSFDPKLTIVGEPIQYLRDHDFKYLGRQMNTQLSEKSCRNDIKSILVALLERLDDADLASTAKLWLYHHFCTTKLSGFLLINDLTLTFVQELQAIALKFLKSWAGLPRCANSAVLFVGERNRFGLCIRNLVSLWKQQQHIRLSLLHSSTDHRCKAMLEIICKRQGSWTKKIAPAVLCSVRPNCGWIQHWPSVSDTTYHRWTRTTG